LWSEATIKPQCRTGTWVPVRAGGVKIEAQEVNNENITIIIIQFKEK
jgi:hypothetical protein